MAYLEYDTLATSFVVILAACAALAVIWGAVKAVREIRRPSIELHELVMEHEHKLLNDQERLIDLKKSNDLQMEMLLQMANHMIDGNHTAQLISCRDSLQKYLIER